MNNPILTDSIHELAKRHRVAFRDTIDLHEINPERRSAPPDQSAEERVLYDLQDQIKALLQDYMPHDMVKEIFDFEMNEEVDIDGMVVVMGSGFVLTVPI